MAEFFAMEGYGVYIWPAYAAFAMVLIGLTVAYLRRNAAVRDELAELEARAAARRQAQSQETPR